MVVSPSMVGLIAMMISLASPFLIRAMRLAILSSAGPMPSMGEMTPPRM